MTSCSTATVNRHAASAVVDITLSVAAAIFVLVVFAAAAACIAIVMWYIRVRGPPSTQLESRRTEGFRLRGAGMSKLSRIVSVILMKTLCEGRRAELHDSASSSTHRILARDPSHSINTIDPRMKTSSTAVVRPRSVCDAYLECEDPDPTESSDFHRPSVLSSANATLGSPDSDIPPYYRRYNVNPAPAHINGNGHIMRTGAPHCYRSNSHVVRVTLRLTYGWMTMHRARTHEVRLVKLLLPVSLPRTQKCGAEMGKEN